MAKSDVFVANTSFAADVDTGKKDEDGKPIFQQHIAVVGRKYSGNHPLVKLAPGYFDSDADGARVYGADPALEAATASPGELRNR